MTSSNSQRIFGAISRRLLQSRESFLRPLSWLGVPLRGVGLVRRNQTFAEIEVARRVVVVALELCAVGSVGLLRGSGLVRAKFRSLQK